MKIFFLVFLRCVRMLKHLTYFPVGSRTVRLSVFVSAHSSGYSVGCMEVGI